MVDATIRVRMRDSARRGRFPAEAVNGLAPGVVLRDGKHNEASSIAVAFPSRLRAASSRPGEGDLVASAI
jgi:hypothetical protein